MTNDFYAAQLRAFKIEEETGLTREEILALPMDEYARLTGRQSPTQAAVATLDARYEASTSQAPAAPAAPAQTQAPEVPDFGTMSMAEYAAYRAQAGIGQGTKEGRGIFNSVGSRSDAYTSAVRAQSGRTALNERGVVAPPRLEGRTVLKQDDHIDHRSASARFSTPGNSWQG
jgi:hypothetical protein